MAILQVFAKCPIVGQVKTRLIPFLGAEGATALYCRLLWHSLSVLSSHFPTQLWYTPNRPHPFWQLCQQHFDLSLHPQQGDDLGARMAHALTSTGDTPTLLIGSDIPMLTPEDIHYAATALLDHDAVFIPVEDGGYGLVGMRRCYVSVFSNITWSCPTVMQQTETRLAAAKLRWYCLPPLWDIDEPHDLARLAKDLYLN